VTLASLTFITAPAANAAPAVISLAGGHCYYDRAKTTKLVTIKNDTCKEVRAGLMYISTSGNNYIEYGQWRTGTSTKAVPGTTTIRYGVAVLKVPNPHRPFVTSDDVFF
jgi:hypothetical protein